MLNKQNFSSNLSVALYVILLFLCLALATILILMQKDILYKNLVQFQLEHKVTIGKNIAKQIDDHLLIAESIAKSLAATSKTLDKNVDLFKQTLPALINKQEAENLIAGGGYWPEPYMFDSKIKRRSFFWGRNNQGKLTYFDDYNKPDGNGYHREEWYVPARYSNGASCYWSKPYIDPYSLQPMVTCTTAILESGTFTGASTIDLKLEKLEDYVASSLKDVKGYGFVVDLNNNFIYHPTIKRAVGTNESMDAVLYAKHNPLFQKILPLLNRLNEELISSFDNADKSTREHIADELTAQSYQISHNEAELIASILLQSKLHPSQGLTLNNFEIATDDYLKEAAYIDIITLPHTHWKIILLSPKADIQQWANRIIYTTLTVIILLITAVSVFLLFCRIRMNAIHSRR